MGASKRNFSSELIYLIKSIKKNAPIITTSRLIINTAIPRIFVTMVNKNGSALYAAKRSKARKEDPARSFFDLVVKRKYLALKNYSIVSSKGYVDLRQ